MSAHSHPKSYLSDAQRQAYANTTADHLCAVEALAATKADDPQTAFAWMACRQDMPPEALLFLKRTSGADFIRKYGFDLQRANEEFGPDWLDNSRY
ncbi:MAG: hypothetical protein LBE59_07835 [Nevskiaceae bacterium]|nr:hypothetical protein [Nevskiaceae bacterium]